jgi:hypothetical protein
MVHYFTLGVVRDASRFAEMELLLWSLHVNYLCRGRSMASVFDSVLREFGIRHTPWVVRVYVTLLLLLMIFAGFALMQVPKDTPGDGRSPAAQVLSTALDGINVILGAVVGSLSLAATKQWGSASETPPEKGRGADVQAGAAPAEGA